jgi:hypothetical protein
MKNSINLSVILGTLVLVGCSPKVTTTLIKAKAPLGPGEEIAVLQPEDAQPEDAVPLKAIRAIGPEYLPLMEEVKKEAMDAGANVVKITDYFSPDIASSRHRIAALAYCPGDADSLRIPQIQLAEVLNVKKETGALYAAINGGAAYLTAKIPDNLGNVEKTHVKNMKFSFTYGAEVSYFFGESAGIGVRFHNFHTSDEMPMSAVINGSIREGYLKDQIDIWFVGPILKGRLLTPSRKQAFLFNYSFGIAGETDRAEVLSVPAIAKGFTLGHMFELGYDFRVSRNFSVGAGLYYLLGIIRDVDIYDGAGNSQHIALPQDSFENVGHVGISIGLRYNL